MSKIVYNPNSHFFVDHSNISNPDPANLTTDAYGPVNGNETTKYRTTSIIRASSPSKVFAICDGHLFIQPQTGNTNKVNLILRPSESYAPFKIKYFIYRGINKSDLIDGDNLALDTSISPTFLQRIWTDYRFFNSDEDNSPPTTFPANLIGYDPDNQPDDSLISTYFFKSSNDTSSSFEIPKCYKGEHLGKFTGEIGLDVVLDYGDYELDYEEQLFKLDLAYARKKEHVFDITTIAGVVKQKRYREHIHQFIDAAAFWGSHIDAGEIKLYNDATPKTNVTDIYNFIVNKYQTKNKLYLYVQSERGRSYNFYNNYPGGQLNFTLTQPPATPPVLEDYKYHDWPILIKEYTQTTTPHISRLQMSLDFDINAAIIHDLNAVFGTAGIVGYDTYSIYYTDRTISKNLNIPNWKSDSFPRESFLRDIKLFPKSNIINDENFSGQTKLIPSIPLNNYLPSGTTNALSTSNFYSIKFRGTQEKLTNYFDDLWYFSAKNSFNLTTIGSGNSCNWLCYNKAILKNLRPIIGISDAALKNKVFFDTGKNSSGTNKTRRLYVAVVNDIFKNPNVLNNDQYTSFINLKSNQVSGFEKNLSSTNYSQTIYNDETFKVFKGDIDDSGVVVPSLTLINTRNHHLKQFYFQLGLLEEEYNKILYDNITIPNPLPSPSHIPTDAVNISFHLEEVTSISLTEDFRKFKLGIKFEDNMGALITKFPSLANEVSVYTIDGFYFFTKEYAEYQEFYTSFSDDSYIHFRPKKTVTTIDVTVGGVTTPQMRDSWDGNYGFDWIRIEDTNMTNDVLTSTYEKKIGHYYDSSNPDAKVGPDDIANQIVPSITFTQEKQEWHALKRIYGSYPIKDNGYSEYTMSWLTLYPSINAAGTATVFPKTTTDGTLKCLVEARIELKIIITATPTSIKLKFEKDHFEITPINAGDMTSLPDTVESGINFSFLEINDKSTTGASPRNIEITIKALKEFDHSKKIQIISNSGSVEKITGELAISPNNKDSRRETKVLFVNVKSNIPSRPYDTGLVKEGMLFATNHDDEIENKITPFFNQGLIDIIRLDKVDLDITPGVVSPHNASYSPTSNAGISYSPHPSIPGQHIFNTSDTIVNDLYNDLISYNPAYSATYRDHFIIFFLNEGQDSGSYGVSEFIGIKRTGAIANKVVVYQDGLHDTTTAHELLHTTGLFHSFSNSNEFTTEQYLTDNIMDYSDFASLPNPLPVIGLWKRQVDIVRNHRLVIKEP